MGTSLSAAPVAAFLGPRIEAEGRAWDQLRALAALPGVSRVAAFPDIHPGRHGPVGVAFWADRLHPLPIGGDIGCGILVARLSKPARKLHLDKAVRAWSDLDAPWPHAGEVARSLGCDPVDARVLGSLGGSNHFLEAQVVGAAPEGGPLAKGDAVLMIHSGSRGLGEAAVAALPQGVGQGMDPNSPEGLAWLAAHDRAVAFARANRWALALRAAEALGLGVARVAEAVHNAVVPWQGGWLHRKGAAEATQPWVPIAGSRSTPSWLVAPSPDAPNTALLSLPHGAGRKFDRAACHGRFQAPKREKDGSVRPVEGGRVLCGDKGLLVEETALAYKDSRRIAEAIEAEGLGSASIRLDPLLTFKSGVVR